MSDRVTGAAPVQVLIAEDSPTQAAWLRHILEGNRFEVLAATDGVQALSVLSESTPALIITDIVMPLMDGFELCRRIKADRRIQHIPVILLTALSGTSDVLEGLACGADNFITKPYNTEYFMQSVARILANSSARDCARERVGLEVVINGAKRAISADPQQMLTLLVSTYEAAVQRNGELTLVQEELGVVNEHLEDLVAKRTEALVAEVAEHMATEEALRTNEHLLRASLKTREVLLREIHHRVKNNLQVIISLLRLQSRKITDAGSIEAFSESQNRIRAMALVHETLYQSDDLAGIEFTTYVTRLTRQLLRSQGALELGIRLVVADNSLILGIDLAIPCGLIVNELVSNAFKHAFPNGRSGAISVALDHSADEGITLTVSDDGVGLAEDLDWRCAEGLGLHLVAILVEDQLHGQIEVDRMHGTAVRIRFKVVQQ